jgi:hypothetical protein
MSVEIKIWIPESLDAQLRDMRDQLPHVIELGLRALRAERDESFQDEDAIMNVLASNPTPDKILALQPSRELERRASDLVSRSKTGELSRAEEKELDRYLTLEHLVRLAKAHAYRRLASVNF